MVPRCTSTVAIGPRPLSSLASMTTPLAVASGLALSSRMSACSRIISRSSSMLRRFFAETLTKMLVPPHSSGTIWYSVSIWRTWSGLAPSLSILFTATMIGTPAALAWWMASIVCGMTPSSAATTSTTTSVALAPRARMAVNASWPGVSMKVICLPSCVTTDAPMCWVMPPASVAATPVSRIASSSDVLPWST